MIRSVVGKSFDSYSGSPCLPATGICRDGDRIYDGNFLELNTSPEGVTIVFSKDNNILWPGYEGRLEHDPADDHYETSCIGGIECVIGRPVSETGTVREASFVINASFRDTEMSIQTYGLSEEEAVTFFIELCRLIDPAG